MLDKFIVGRVTRISPEAPVPVVAFDHEMLPHGRRGQRRAQRRRARRPGDAHRRHRHRTTRRRHSPTRCRDAGIAPSLVGDASRPTTTKVRIVTERNQQVARIDYEVDAEIAGDIEHRVIAEIAAARAARVGDRHLRLSEGVHHAARGAGGRAPAAGARRAGARRSEDPARRLLRRHDAWSRRTITKPRSRRNMRVRSRRRGARAPRGCSATRAQCGAC